MFLTGVRKDVSVSSDRPSPLVPLRSQPSYPNTTSQESGRETTIFTRKIRDSPVLAVPR